MLGWNESAWFSIFIGAALKSTAVLGAACLLAFLLRKRSAAARHVVKNNRQPRCQRNRAVVLIQTFLRRLIVIGRYRQQSVHAHRL